VLAYSARGFSDKAAIPVIGMQSVPDLDLSRYFWMMVKTAVTDDRDLTTWHYGKRRWDRGVIPAHHFLDKSDRLLAFGINA